MKNYKLKLILAAVAGLILAFGASRLLADDAGKEVTITGNMACGKCTLHITDKCQNVVQVTQDGKTTDYFLKQNDVSNDAHGAICHGDTEKVTVTGTVEEKDGKEMMTPTKIVVDKS
jgi:hypothetical protein